MMRLGIRTVTLSHVEGRPWVMLGIDRHGRGQQFEFPNQESAVRYATRLGWVIHRHDSETSS